MKRKTTILLILLFFTLSGHPAIYYVSGTGSDANSGLTASLPWQTIGKVNATAFNAGDQILFKKGDTFYGSLTISRSGTALSPIMIGAYGTGANPIITGFTTVTSWANLGNNIWESSSAVSTLSALNMVSVNGVNTPMGRYPNTNATNGGYLTFQSHASATSITSNGLTGAPNWAGAELVLRESHPLMERFSITSQSGSTLNFSPFPVYAPLDGFGFFIQNDARTLDQQNEWYYNPSAKKIKMYSTAMPTGVKAATVSSLLIITGNYVTVNGVDFTGSNGENITGNGAHTTIQNCHVSFSGYNHVNTGGAYYTILDNTFNDTNNNGVSVEGSYSIISRNTFTNSGINHGMGRSSGLGINSALSVGGEGKTDFTIEQNIVTLSGSNGIVFYANNVSVKNNFVDTYCTVLDDGGGIYTYTGDRRAMMTGCKIEGNIVINGVGAPDGSTSSFPTIAAGIYCDEQSADVEIFNNTLANAHEYGIYQNINHDNNIHDNTVYNSTNAQLRASWSTGITVNNNIFVAKEAGQNILYIASGNDSNNPPIPTWITANNNRYARPVDDNKVIFVEQPGVNGADRYKTLSEWKAFSSQDANSLKSPQTVISTNDLQFEYNATLANKTIALAHPMMDMKGTKYANSVTLLPYTSVVMVRDLTPDTTAPTVTSFTAVTNSYSLTVTITAFTATDNTGVTGYLLTESPTAPTAGQAGWTSVRPVSRTFATYGTKTLWAWARDGAGNISTGATAQVTLIDLTPPSSGKPAARQGMLLKTNGKIIRL